MLVTLLTISFSIVIPVENLYSQSINSWYTDLDKWLADVVDEEDISLENLYEQLSEIHENPLNINTLTKEQLESLIFLSDAQIESILAYVYIYGPMKTLSELQLVENMDFDTRKLLNNFVYAGEVSVKGDLPRWKNIWKYGKHELITRVDVPFYRKAGYKEYSDSILNLYPNRQYLGNPYYHSVRYGFRYGNKVYFGLVAEKDAGEPFFAKGTNGYDYYSFYLMLKDIGRLKAFVAGNYRLRFGQGLVMNTDFSLGKATMLSSLGWGGNGIKKHSSTSESNAFQGMAATYQLWKMECTAFFSYRKQDANLNKEGFITTLKTDGMHRTPLEYSKKNNITNTLCGSNLAYHSGGYHFGLTAVYNVFNHMLKPGEQYYKRYYPRGSNFFTAGVDYAYFKHNLALSGETGMSKNGGLATLNSIQYQLSEDYKITLLQRYYSHNYWALYGNSFSENSNLQNESGVYLGLEAKPWEKWKLTGYVDFCYFPWVKYQVSNSSYAGEFFIKGVYSLNKRFITMVNYRCKVKEKDYMAADKHKYLASHVHHRLRYQQDYSPSGSFLLGTIIDYNRLQFMEKSGNGYMITQRVSWMPLLLPISLNASICYFNTDSYENRIGIYEHGLLYTFSFPSFYYHGIHGAATLHWVINKWLTTRVKISGTNYFNRPTIGSNTELINSSHREDVSIQLCCKL